VQPIFWWTGMCVFVLSLAVISGIADTFRVDGGFWRKDRPRSRLKALREQLDPARYSAAGQRWRLVFTLAFGAFILFGIVGLLFIRW
jgi:hypothetical protein